MSGTTLIADFILLALYMAPTIVGARRRHRQAGPILAINLIFGWTGLGWVAAMAWSLTSDTRKEVTA